MATCDWALMCDYAFLDVNRKLCLIGIFDRILAPAVPATQHHAALALKLVGEAKESVRLRLEVVRPRGEVLAKIEGGGKVYIGDHLARTIGVTVGRTPQNSPAG